jgi:hypothetical protein
MKKIFPYIVLIIFVQGCVQKFQPSIPSPTTGYLVVEGIINSGGGAASVSLSRTTVLTDTTLLHETGASVQVEGNDNSVYPFTEKGNGVYGTTQLLLNNAQQYRLDIKTKDGKQYLSDYSSPKTTPPIDSLNWNATNDGLQIYVNTHDAANNTIYYKWDYVETWEFHSPFYQTLTYDTIMDPSGKPEISVKFLSNFNQSIYTCWQSLSSSQLIIGSSANLASDVISEFPVDFIQSTDPKISVEFSVLVNQYALTKSAYDFLQIMQKNTEETGSIFGTQPSQLTGNVHSVSNPSEIIIGYVGFASLQSKRIFIFKAALPSTWLAPNSGCIQDSIYPVSPPPSSNPYLQITDAFTNGLIPTTPITIDFFGNITRFFAAAPECVDCRYRGTNQQPSFWQ